MIERIKNLVDKLMGVKETVTDYAEKGKETVTDYAERGKETVNTVTETSKNIVDNVKAAYGEVSTGFQRAWEHLQNIKTDATDAVAEIKGTIKGEAEKAPETPAEELENAGDDPNT